MAKKELFQEAIDHCRWKNTLKIKVLSLNELSIDNIINYKNNTFEDIFIKIYNLTKTIYGIGLLCVYDMTSAICRYNNININKIYIIGNGPKKAIKLLNIKYKLQKINKDITLKYVEINEVINEFKLNNIKININNIINGDEFESFLCNWQKQKN
jgi:hypothetical protein